MKTREQILADRRGEYSDLYFRYLAACRDYPYTQHPPPEFPFIIGWVRFCEELRREFNRRT